MQARGCSSVYFFKHRIELKGGCSGTLLLQFHTYTLQTNQPDLRLLRECYSTSYWCVSSSESVLCQHQEGVTEKCFHPWFESSPLHTSKNLSSHMKTHGLKMTPCSRIHDTPP